MATTTSVPTEKQQATVATGQLTPIPTPFEPVTTNTSTSGPAGRTIRSRLPTPLQKVYDILSWTPPRCRWDPENPPEFSMSLNVLFGFAGAFTVANLYYNHPILNILADDFQVDFETASQIPTLMQGGYAAGLLFLCPLGDIFKRRSFVLLLVLFTSTIWIGLCITKSFTTFLGISFVVAVTTVTPQLMLPLVGELAPPHRRAAALGIVVSGLTMGILIARVLSGIITNYASWRYVYWMSCGLQYLIFILLWLFMPDYPSTNPGGVNYFKMLYHVGRLVTQYGVLVQACFLTFLTSATFTSFWTTLTFLLAGPPYNYEPLPIGLFGLIGIGGMICAPLYARLVTDRFVPLFSAGMGELMCLVGIVVGTYTGTFSIAGPVIQAFLLDLGLQTAAIANRSSIYTIEPKARNRVNTAFMMFTFTGQLTGTAAGNHLYAQGGWLKSGGASVGIICATIVVIVARGPREKGWIGWHGGWSIFKEDKMTADGTTKETSAYAKAEKPVVNGDIEKGSPVEEGAIEKGLDELAADSSRKPE